MFRMACGLRERGGWEIQPSEFWRMSPGEWWGIYDINIGESIKHSTETIDRLKRLYFQAKKK